MVRYIRLQQVSAVILTKAWESQRVANYVFPSALAGNDLRAADVSGDAEPKLTVTTTLQPTTPSQVKNVGPM